MSTLTLTDADIDQMLFERELTPAGAARLRAKLREPRAARRAKPAAKPDQALPPLPSTPPQSDLMDKLREMMSKQGPFPPAKARDCLFESFRRANPNHTGPLGISCPCPRCSPGMLARAAEGVVH